MPKSTALVAHAIKEQIAAANTLLQVKHCLLLIETLAEIDCTFVLALLRLRIMREVQIKKSLRLNAHRPASVINDRGIVGDCEGDEDIY